MEASEPEKKRRLFFALLPAEDERIAVQRIVEAAPAVQRGRPIPAEQWHVTLLFIGGAEETTISCLRQAAAEVRGASFELTLDHLGYWRRSQILWLGAAACPPVLQRLMDELRTAVAPCNIALEERPFKPHVTLARNLRRRPAPHAIAPIRWRVDRFHLMESLSASGGVGYRVVETWKFAARAASSAGE